MADLQSIMHDLHDLTPDEVRKLFAHIKESYGQILEQKPRTKGKQRIFDLHAGKIRMSDDFDQELPDSFWLGEE
jgi:hypothetical protein